MLRMLVFASPVLMLAAVPQGGTVAAGKTRFAAECSLCHSAEPGDGGGGAGPDLHKLVGRAAGTADPAYSYSEALRGSRIVWDTAQLDRFLADPARVVPGTTMPASVTDPSQRAELIAYLTSLKAANPQP